MYRVEPQKSVLLITFRCGEYEEQRGLYWSIQNLHILAGIFSLDFLFLEGKSPLLMRNNQGNFGNILPETSKSSAFWDMGVDSHLKLLFSPDEVLASRMV